MLQSFTSMVEFNNSPGDFSITCHTLNLNLAPEDSRFGATPLDSDKCTCRWIAFVLNLRKQKHHLSKWSFLGSVPGKPNMFPNLEKVVVHETFQWTRKSPGSKYWKPSVFSLVNLKKVMESSFPHPVHDVDNCVLNAFAPGELDSFDLLEFV